MLLSGRPRRRGAEQGVCQGLVVGEEGEITTFQEETEMADRKIGCQEFSVEDIEYLDLAEESFVEKKGKGGPGTRETLLKNSTHVRVKRINSQGDVSTGFRVSKDRDRGKEELGMAEGGVENWGPLERLTRTLEGVG